MHRISPPQSLLYGLSLFLFGLAASAQTPLTFEHLSLEQELSHGTVYAVMQDETGFMWFGTEGGLNRYDGYTFKTYLHNPLDSNSLANSNVTSIIQDRTGTIWLATWGGGLDAYDPKSDRFYHFKNDPKNPSSLSDNRVQSLFEDPSGHIWIGTYSGGANELDPVTGKIIIYKNDPSDPQSLSNNRVWSFAVDSSGQFWIGTGDGLDLLVSKDDRPKFKIYKNDPKDPKSISHSMARTILSDSRGRMWIGTQKGLNRFDPASGSFIRFSHEPGNPYSLNHDTINCLYEHPDGSIWAGTIDGGINALDPETSRLTFILHNSNQLSSISHNDVRAIYLDRSHNLWIGTRGGGLNKIDLKPEKFELFNNEPSNPNSLNDNRVWAILEDEKARQLWIGTDRGVDQYDLTQRKFVHWVNDPANPNSVSNNSVRALYQDELGALWIGTSGGGLNVFDPATRRFKRYTHDANNPQSLSDNRVRALLGDGTGKIWIGTYQGLNYFDPHSGSWQHFRHDGSPGSLSHDEVRVLAQDRKERLWIGTYGGGLNLWDPAAHSFKTFKHDQADPSSICSNDILSLAVDPNEEVLWIGTDGNGFNRLDLTTGKFEQLTTADGLSNDVVYGILPDVKGYLWISTNKGLSRYDPHTKVFRNYDVHDGLQSNIFGQGAYFRSKNGTLYFGGIGGLNRFDPEHVVDNPHVPAIVLTEFRKFDKSMLQGRVIGNGDHINLNYYDYYFSLEFASLDFTKPVKNQYAYQLVGFDQNWVFSGNRHYASYTNLHGGDYIFKVKGSNNDGLWNPSGIEIRVTIAPPYWETLWFRFGIFLLLVGIVYTGYRYRVRTIEAQKLSLQSEVALRTAELRGSQLELEQKNNQILEQNERLVKLDETKNELLGMAAHDLRSPLTTIVGYADLILFALEEKNTDHAQIKEDLRVVSGAAMAMQKLITELLDISAIESGKIRLDLHKENLASILEECEKLQRRSATQKNIAMTVELPPSLPPVTIDRAKITEVVDNLITNAIKFTNPGGKVRVFCETLHNEVITHVQDSGLGLDQNDLSQIFTSFKKLSAKPTGGESSTGLGLAIVKKIVDMHHGRIWVESEKGKGSIFSFALPAQD